LPGRDGEEIVKTDEAALKESINFDRAAGFYDATRKLPDNTGEAITQALLREIRAAGADRVLEVGIGTGRIARPLMREGVRMVGVDISREMMGQLREQLTTGHTTPDLILGDATALPLAAGSFQAAMVVHVLHLVSSVEQTLGEIRRVLAPEGVLLHQTRMPTAETERVWDDSHDEWGRLLGERGFVRRPRHDQVMIREKIAESGASLRLVDVTRSTETSTVDEELKRLRARSPSWTWLVPGELLDNALPEYETWLRAAAPNGWTDDVTIQLEVWHWD
jgi:ubiquinone/menaquinone biosynthesis C-methylase UbiE